jgi:23S rRNA pseudouridine2604 synthase
MRLNKFIAQKTKLSRRKADELIESQRVYLNGSLANLGSRLEPGDLVFLMDQEFRFQDEESTKHYLAVNKAVGIECTCDRNNPDNIIDFILSQPEAPKKEIVENLYPIGRLDKDSRGLIILTNDGDFCYRMSHPKFQHEKEYEVLLDREPSSRQLEKLSAGIEIGFEDGSRFLSSPCKIEKFSTREVRIILKEGKNRQIRRMFQSINLRVLDLCRNRIEKFDLKSFSLMDRLFVSVNPDAII